MVKLTRPLFGDEAEGMIKKIGIYTMRNGNPVLQRMPLKTKKEGETLKLINLRYSNAMNEWLKLPKLPVGPPGREKYVRIPSWPEFFTEWCKTHPLMK